MKTSSPFEKGTPAISFVTITPSLVDRIRTKAIRIGRAIGLVKPETWECDHCHQHFTDEEFQQSLDLHWRVFDTYSGVALCVACAAESELWMDEDELWMDEEEPSW